ncbi:MAG: FecR domain-containing protein [Proteobacteria bacterium]|nr:FecR domain-containing protein [Pseudomonadota bacterium]
MLHRFPGALSRESFHVTQLGGHRTLGLPDGSTVELNTSSQLAVDFGITCRCLRLLSGEAVFHAAHGDPRPFKVQAGATTTRDIGTEFWIQRAGNEHRGAGRIRRDQAARPSGFRNNCAPTTA